MLRSCFKKRSLFILIIFLFFLNAVSLSRVYNKIFDIIQDGLQEEEINTLLKFSANEKSEKWFVYYLIGEKYFSEKKYSKAIKYLSVLNKYSYIKNPKTYEMEIISLLRENNYRNALKKLENYKVYKSKSTKDISFLMYLIFIIGTINWIIFGFYANHDSIFYSNIITTSLAIYILVAKIKYG